MIRITARRSWSQISVVEKPVSDFSTIDSIHNWIKSNWNDLVSYEFTVAGVVFVSE